MKKFAATIIVMLLVSVQAQKVCDKGGTGVRTLWNITRQAVSNTLFPPFPEVSGSVITSSLPR
jgi:hypothetical protein